MLGSGQRVNHAELGARAHGRWRFPANARARVRGLCAEVRADAATAPHRVRAVGPAASAAARPAASAAAQPAQCGPGTIAGAGGSRFGAVAGAVAATLRSSPALPGTTALKEEGGVRGGGGRRCRRRASSAELLPMLRFPTRRVPVTVAAPPGRGGAGVGRGERGGAVAGDAAATLRSRWGDHTHTLGKPKRPPGRVYGNYDSVI